MSRRRRILLVAIAALALLVALAPLLARTGAARRFVASRISRALGRPVEIRDLDAGWASGVALHGLVVRNGTPEFQGAPLVEARSVRLEGAIPGLVFSGASDVAIDGLVVRLEEQAGGRTNVDDLVASLAKPRPAVKREARPFRFRLTDASIRVRRLVRRPQPRPIDPFREDPVILDADEGLLVFGLDDLDLRLTTAPPAGARLDLSAAVDVAGNEGRAEIAVRLDAKGPSGTVRLEGIDLGLLRPFVQGIEGRLDVRVEGSPDGADVRIRAENLKVARLDEAWADLSGRIRREGDGIAFDALSLRTASEAFSLDGRGAWPPRDLEIRARASPEALGLRVKGPLVLDARGEGAALSGTLRSPDLDARFDASLREGGVEVRKLEANAFGSSLSLEGEVAESVRLSGRAAVNLADLQPLLPEGATLAGRLRVETFSLDGLALKADADVSGLVARGLFAEDLDLERGELHVDASLSADRDVLRIARGQLDGLAAQGTVSGLKHGALRADGTVKGTLALHPFHARLLGLGEARGLRGQVTLDVTASTGEKGVEASGTAAIEGFHVESARGAWDLARIAADGAYRGGDATVHATADGARLAGSFEGGKGTVEMDVDAIERQPLLAGLLPADLTLKGPLSLRADVERGPWKVRGTLESTGLTARVDGRGVEGEPLRLSFAAAEEGKGWSIDLPSLAFGRLGVTAKAGGFLGDDGSKGGNLVVEGPAAGIAALAPEAAALAPEGRFTLAARIDHDRRWSFGGEIGLEDASVVVSAARVPIQGTRIEFDGRGEGDGSVTLRRVRVATRTSDLEGDAVLGPAIRLRMKGRTRLEEIAPFAPAFKGSGEVTFDEFALDLSAAGELAASSSFHTAAVRVEGGKLTKATVRFRVEGRLAKGALEGVKTDLAVAAARAERGNILVEDLAVRERGSGHSAAYVLGTRIDAGKVVVGATSWEQVGLDLRGRLDRLLGERPPTGLEGEITFARWHLGPFLWEDAKGEVAVERGNVVVKNLVAGLHGGTVRAEGRLLPSGDRLAWEGSARAQGLVLTEQIGRPLSFIIPFLRVKKEAGQLAGRADFNVRLAADDTTDAAILRTLAGAGDAHLYDIEAKNSILLPLLSFRLDKAILREPFRFKDLKVAFDVGDGSIRPEPFELEATPFGIKVKEIEVGLDGSVDALIVPGILPLRVGGTLDDPKVRPAPLAPFR